MKIIELDEQLRSLARLALVKTELFEGVSEKTVDEIMKLTGKVRVFEDQEVIFNSGDAADCFYLILKGEASFKIGYDDNFLEIDCKGSGQLIGEDVMILDDKHPHTIIARGQVKALVFDSDIFFNNLLYIYEVDVALMKLFAQKIKSSSSFGAINEKNSKLPEPDYELMHLLPIEFMYRHRVVPIKQQKNLLLIAYSAKMNQTLLNLIARLLPGMQLTAVYVANDYFEGVLKSYAGSLETKNNKPVASSVAIDELLRRLVEEGGSDLHLSAGQVPRWRINGEILMITGFTELAENEVLEFLAPAIKPEILSSFEITNDEDFAYSIADKYRFRVNLFRGYNGVSAVLRHIPSAILSLEALGLPHHLYKMCEQPKGLVLVTGPTGSGKSTTLAAMIDWINKKRKCHILTIEDPIEFVYKSETALINQREVGAHTRSFGRALKAALREDPDVVLIGEMRDNETVQMALETANTGHLVFATLHTSTASSTIDRIVDNFPADAQNQIRNFLADCLIGVVSQTLCRRKSAPGRVPAVEVMLMDYAMANLIRSAKTHMLPNSMLTAQAKGNRLLNDDLLQLVSKGMIAPEEALEKTRDKGELEKKLVAIGAIPFHPQAKNTWNV